MTNSAGRPVFQQNAFRRAGGCLYRPAGHLIIEIGPVIQNLGGMILACGSKNCMAGPQARHIGSGGKFSHILHCNAPIGVL